MNRNGQGRNGEAAARPRRVQRWAAIVALLAVPGLLLVFAGVARDAVRQGVAMRESTAMRANARWRCRLMPLRDARTDCLQQLAAAAPAGSTVPVVADMTVAQRP